jgi:cystathionine beta-lyase
MNDETRCVISPPVETDGFDSLGVPIYRASTIPFPDAESYDTRHLRGDEGYSYGLSGTPTTRALERKITALEQGVRTFLVPSGQAAISIAILSFIAAGDRILIADTVYPPLRDFAVRDLAKFGVDVVFYDPTAPEEVERLITDRTRIVWAESPGSTTMEMQDIARISEIAHRHGALVGCDNTWATPLNFKPLAHGADIVVEALTKYFSGHSDVLMGSITLRDAGAARTVKDTLSRLGVGVSPDDCSLVLRGMETMAVRLRQAAQVARDLVDWIAGQPTVAEILYPPLPASPGHALWRRDFRGGSGVFSIVFKPEAVPHVHAALDTLKVFAIGASWGGTRSLVAPMRVRQFRTARPWTGDDLVLRISVGMEAASDLMEDLSRFFDCLNGRSAPGPEAQSGA